MTFVIGVDGGGSHTSATLLNFDGQILSEGKSGPSNIHSVGIETACRNILEAIRQAAKDGRVRLPVECVYCALSGAGRKEDRESIKSTLSSKTLTENLIIGHDGESTIASAGILEGMAVLAGTGSFVWGRNSENTEARADGWGSILGDEGGAFSIGLHAIRAVCRMHDQRGPETALLEKAMEYFEISEPHQLIALAGKLNVDRNSISNFAQSVFQAYDEMDAVSVNIIEFAVTNLIDSILAVRKKLFRTEDRVSLVCGGHLLTKVQAYQERFHDLWQRRFPNDKVIIPEKDLSYGAAVLGLNQLGISIQPESASTHFTEWHIVAEESEKENKKIFEECRKLGTEKINPDSVNIEQSSVQDILRLINQEDQKVAFAVQNVLPEIEECIEKIVMAFSTGGRLFYIGAGTSGRLGCLDASECPPTYGTPPWMIQGIISGGFPTLIKSREGVEDQRRLAIKDLKDRNLKPNDILIGIAASNRTPYVLEGLKYAREMGAQNCLVTCNPPEFHIDFIDLVIAPETGPEVVMGSTRMKAGTAQKMVLNMLTTTAMIRSGKVFRGMMVDLQMTSKKLAQRAIRTIMMLTHLDYQSALELLKLADGHVKTALVMHETSCNSLEAQKLLEENGGFVADAIQSVTRAKL